MSSHEEDQLLYLLFILSGATGFGLFSVGTFLRPAREWMVDHGILVSGDGVIIPLADRVGLDLARVVIAIGVLIFLAVVAAVILRRRGQRDV